MSEPLSEKNPAPEQDKENGVVYWPRVKEILDGLMQRWEERRGRRPLPGIHRYYWDSPEQLANDVLSGVRAIEPGIPGRQTQFVRSLARSVGTWGRMPLRGPFLSESEIDEIVSWIDGGMPAGPPDRSEQAPAETPSD
jgi:mono/diheme cytochrome c family protein